MSSTDTPAAVRRQRFVAPMTAGLAVIGALFGAAVLPGPIAALAPALGVGLFVQLVATVVLVRVPSRPDVGLAAVTAAAALMLLVDSPWKVLLGVQGVPWVPVAIVWATARVVDGVRTPRQAQVSAVIAVAYVAVAGTQAASASHGSVLTAALSAATPILGGLCVSLAARLRQARRDRIAALERERAAVADMARADERQRIAVQMHDSLGSLLTLLVLHANALTVSAREPDFKAAAERMSRLGTDGLAELRQLLTLLQDPETSTSSAPADTPDAGPAEPDGLDELAAEARGAGQTVRFARHGDRIPLPRELARTVHRVAQEGLTNSRRHAPGSEVDLTVTVEGDAVSIEVRNGLATSPGTGAGTGWGLDGLRRRVTLLGGHSEHAPTPDGGYALSVSLPLGAAIGRTSGTGNTGHEGQAGYAAR